MVDMVNQIYEYIVDSVNLLLCFSVPLMQGRYLCNRLRPMTFSEE